MIEKGNPLPEARLYAKRASGVETISARDFCAKGKSLLFGLPGAFTPTCDANHLPGYIELAPALGELGVARIACVSVNDAFVMGAWGAASGTLDRVEMLADPDAEFARALGLEQDLGAGFGVRSKRYAMLVEDGIVRALWLEPGGGLSVSSAAAVVEALKA